MHIYDIREIDIHLEQQRRWYSAALIAHVYDITSSIAYGTCIYIIYKQHIFTRAAEALLRDGPNIAYTLYYFQSYVTRIHIIYKKYIFTSSSRGAGTRRPNYVYTIFLYHMPHAYVYYTLVEAGP